MERMGSKVSHQKMLAEIREKVMQGERLGYDEGVFLMQEADILALGEMAAEVKRRKTGKRVFFNVNRHVNITNVCVSRCKFCAFGRDKNAPGAYTMSLEEIMQCGREAVEQGATELHIVSGLHPDLPFSFYVEVLTRLKETYPSLHLQAFTAVEIDYFSRISGLSVREVLTTLKQAGLGSMPGGGAEILSDRIRSVLCPNKASTEQWLEVMRTAHSLGIKSNATMLYGHIETAEERIVHLLKLRELQDETGGFQSFIPLRFHPENTALCDVNPTSAVEDLRVLAVSRLMLDNFEHIKAFWIMLGVAVAQISLAFGVDDLDGTVVEEKITHAAGATTEKGISKETLIRLIKEAGCLPVERDTVYNIIQEY